MSRSDNHQTASQSSPPEPLNPISEWCRANWARVHLDYDGIGYAIKEHARRRAPNERSIGRHQLGFAGEVAASTICGVSADWTVHPDWVGDSGFDFIVDGSKVEVKTTAEMEEPRLEVPVDRVDDADQFVLAVCENPRHLVYVVGFIDRPDLKTFGRPFDENILVGLERLHPFEPREVFPDRVRDVQDPHDTLSL